MRRPCGADASCGITKTTVFPGFVSVPVRSFCSAVFSFVRAMFLMLCSNVSMPSFVWQLMCMGVSGVCPAFCCRLVGRGV